MSETQTLATQPRDKFGGHANRHLRKTGQLPAVLYGHKEATVALSISQEALVKALKSGGRVVHLAANGTTEQALIKEVQWDYLGTSPLHVDFERVSDTDRVEVRVTIELRGQANLTPGSTLDQPLHTLHVECPATAVPDRIRVSIEGLSLGQAIHVRELKLPDGVTTTDDPNIVVVQVISAVAEETTSETAEPEVIGRQAKDKEAAEGE
jgi:large subunit ribosomal protein L25